MTDHRQAAGARTDRQAAGVQSDDRTLGAETDHLAAGTQTDRQAASTSDILIVVQSEACPPPETSDAAAKCPICRESNQCRNAAGMTEETCWCAAAVFPPGIFAQVPADLLNKSCICESCLEKYKRRSE